MALNFPSSPSVGDVYQRWQWNGTSWVTAPTAAQPMLPIAGGNITGNLGVAGTTTLTGTLSAAGQTNLNTVDVAGTLDVNGQATFDDGVEIDGEVAATRPWVDQQIAAGSLWQGTWAAATNVPDLTNVNLQNNGFTWAVTLADPTSIFTIPPTPVLPGLNGQTVYNGDHIIWSTTASQFQIVPGSSLSLSEAQDMFVDKAGDTMTGQLVLPADPTANLQASTKQYVDNNLPPVRIYQIANVALVTAPPGASSRENRATIPGWTLASRDLIFLYGRLDIGAADAEFMLNINSLGPYPVRMARSSIGGKQDMTARQMFQTQVTGTTGPGTPHGPPNNFGSVPGNLNTWAGGSWSWNQRPENTDNFFVLRFNGTYFVEGGDEDVYRNMARDYYGVTGYRESDQQFARFPYHARFITSTQDNFLPVIAADIMCINSQNQNAPHVLRFKLPTYLGPPGYNTTPQQWNNDAFTVRNPVGLYRKRKLLFQGGGGAAMSLRFPNHIRYFYYPDPSNLPNNSARVAQYNVKVSQRLIDGGRATLGAGYVDLPVPVGWQEMEIDYMFTEQGSHRSALFPQGVWASLPRSMWAGTRQFLYIFDVHLFRGV